MNAPFREYKPVQPYRRPGALDACRVPSHTETAMNDTKRQATVITLLRVKPENPAPEEKQSQPFTANFHEVAENWKTREWPEALRVMGMLSARAEGLKAIDIAKRLQTTPQAAGALLARMRKNSYPVRIRNAGAKRGNVWLLDDAATQAQPQPPA